MMYYSSKKIINDALSCRIQLVQSFFNDSADDVAARCSIGHIKDREKKQIGGHCV